MEDDKVDLAVEQVVDRTIVRGDQGKFAKGSSGGPGRMPVRIAHEYLSVFLGRCTLDRWAEVVDLALEDATSDNVAARRYGREWLSRIIFPAVEKVLSQTLNVNIEASESKEAVKKLLEMLTPVIEGVTKKEE